MKSRNTITLTLMSASILLLLVLQILWLQNSYEKAFYDLRRDGNHIFRNTLFSIRDSLFLKNVQALPNDSTRSIVFKEFEHTDSMRVNMRSSNVQVIVKSSSRNEDSLIEALRPMAHYNFRGQDGKKFMIQLTSDTISADTLKLFFKKALEEANLPIAFLMHHDFSINEGGPPFRIKTDAAPFDPTRDASLNIYQDTMKLEAVRLNPISRYSASFLGFRGFILKSIAPQILFSIILTFITLIAFFVLYKNLRSQQRLMDIKNDFINNVTHELKTPVATVSVALEALKNFHGLDNPARTKEYLEIAQMELNRLTLMTDKILKAGAFENQEIAIPKELIDARSITQQVLDSLKLLFEKNKAQLSFETVGDNFEMHGEASHMTNVIYNLLDNALKYSPNEPTIKVLLQENADHLSLSIQDSGLGIPSEYKTKIFEKFFRVPTGDVHNIKGYGLGLSYVSSVVKAHGGSVEVESEPGKGSNFKIILPISRKV